MRTRAVQAAFLLLFLTIIACGGGGGFVLFSGNLDLVNLSEVSSVKASFVGSDGKLRALSPSTIPFDSVACRENIPSQEGSWNILDTSNSSLIYSGPASVPFNDSVTYVLLGTNPQLDAYKIEPAQLSDGKGEIRVFESLSSGSYDAYVQLSGSGEGSPVNKAVLDSSNRVTWDGHGDQVLFVPGTYSVLLRSRIDGSLITTSPQFTLGAGERVWVATVDRGNGPETVFVPTKC